MATRTDTHHDGQTSTDRGRPWLLAAVLLTAVVSLLLLFLPLVNVVENERGTRGPVGANTTVDRQSLVELEGWAAVVVCAAPVLICAAPLLARRRRRAATAVAAGLLCLAVLVGIASLGLFYLPSAALMVVAVVRTGRPRELSPPAAPAA